MAHSLDHQLDLEIDELSRWVASPPPPQEVERLKGYTKSARQESQLKLSAGKHSHNILA